MKFSEAMRELENGKKVRKKNWSANEYISKNGADDGLEFMFVQSLCVDYEWELYEEPGQLLSFQVVIKGLKEGKRFRRINWSDLLGIESSEVDDVTWVSDGKRFSLNLQDIEANDWVEVK